MVILQNAYGVRKGYIPSYEKESFRNCHTGRRLKKVLPDNIDVSIINASPIVGRESTSNFKPDIEYVKNKYREIKPDLILACGINAKKVVDELSPKIPVFKMPHPAYRALTNETLLNVREQIESVM